MGQDQEEFKVTFSCVVIPREQDPRSLIFEFFISCIFKAEQHFLSLGVMLEMTSHDPWDLGAAARHDSVSSSC